MKTIYWILAFLFITSSSFGRSIFKVEGNDVTINLEGIGVKSKILKVEIWSPSAVKIITTKNETFSTEPSLIGQRNLAPVKFKAIYAQNIVEITTDKLLINIEEDGLVRLLSRDGKILLVESLRSLEPLQEPGTYKVSQRFFLNKNEHIYGMGQEDKVSRYNLRGKSFDINQSVSSIASPYIYSEKGYALIWDNYSNTHFADTPGGMQLTSDVAKDIQFFFVYGPEWTSVVSEIRTLSGNVPLLPKWAYGFFLNQENYKNSDDLNKAIERYQSLGLPVETKNSTEIQLLLEEEALTANLDASSIYLNAYAYSKLKDKYKQLKETTTDRRLCIPTQTNLPGIQQYGTFLTPGNITSCWESLNSQVSSGIVSTLSGLPYWSTALGGTTPKENCTIESREELLVRWYQFAALAPIFQGATNDREIWVLGDESNKNFRAAAKAIQLRYQLLPYIYTTASDVVFQNKSMMRSLLFEYLSVDATHDIDKQYLLGQSLMVCPVTTQGAKEIPVVFPQGTNWYDFYAGKLYTGGTSLKFPVTIDNIPVFVKQGSILPIATLTKNSLDSLNAPIEIRIYPGINASYTLYEDANDGNGYLQEQSSRITFEYDEKGKTLTIGAPEGTYPGMFLDRIFNVVVVSEQNGLGNAYATTKQEVIYKGKKVKLKLQP